MTSEPDWNECRVCGAPAEAYGSLVGMKGVGTRGQDIIVWMEKWECIIGHKYQVEIYEEDR